MKILLRIQKVEKDTTKAEHFFFSVGNIDHLSCLEKVEHPYENQFRQQHQGACKNLSFARLLEIPPIHQYEGPYEVELPLTGN